MRSSTHATPLRLPAWVEPPTPSMSTAPVKRRRSSRAPAIGVAPSKVSLTSRASRSDVATSTARRPPGCRPGAARRVEPAVGPRQERVPAVLPLVVGEQPAEVGRPRGVGADGHEVRRVAVVAAGGRGVGRDVGVGGPAGRCPGWRSPRAPPRPPATGTWRTRRPARRPRARRPRPRRRASRASRRSSAVVGPLDPGRRRGRAGGPRAHGPPSARTPSIDFSKATFWAALAAYQMSRGSTTPSSTSLSSRSGCSVA